MEPSALSDSVLHHYDRALSNFVRSKKRGRPHVEEQMGEERGAAAEGLSEATVLAFSQALDRIRCRRISLPPMISAPLATKEEVESLMRFVLDPEQEKSAQEFSIIDASSTLPLIPGMSVDGVDFSFPLTSAAASELLRLAGERIDARRIEFRNPEFTRGLESLAENAGKCLGVSCLARPVGLVLASPGSCIVDTFEVLDEQVFGYLLIQFPSRVDGGRLRLSSNEEATDFAQAPEFDYQCVACFRHVQRSWSMITSGAAQAVLVCTLSFRPGALAWNPWQDSPSRAMSRLAGALAGLLERHPFFLLGTELKYADDDLEDPVDVLVETDLGVFRLLEKLSKCSGGEIMFGMGCLVQEVVQSGEVERRERDYGSQYGRRGYYGYDWDDYDDEDVDSDDVVWSVESDRTTLDSLFIFTDSDQGQVPHFVIQDLAAQTLLSDVEFDDDPDSESEDAHSRRRETFRATCFVVFSTKSGFALLPVDDQLRTCLKMCRSSDPFYRSSATRLLGQSFDSIPITRLQLQCMDQFGLVDTLSTILYRKRVAPFMDLLKPLGLPLKTLQELIPIVFEPEKLVWLADSEASRLAIFSEMIQLKLTQDNSNVSFWLSIVRDYRYRQLAEKSCSLAEIHAQITSNPSLETLESVLLLGDQQLTLNFLISLASVVERDFPSACTALATVAAKAGTGRSECEPLIQACLKSCLSCSDHVVQFLEIASKFHLLSAADVTVVWSSIQTSQLELSMESVAKIGKYVHETRHAEDCEAFWRRYLNSEADWNQFEALLQLNWLQSLVSECAHLCTCIKARIAHLKDVLSSPNYDIPWPIDQGAYFDSVCATIATGQVVHVRGFRNRPEAIKASQQIWNAYKRYVTVDEGGAGSGVHVILKPTNDSAAIREKDMLTMQLALLQSVLLFELTRSGY